MREVLVLFLTLLGGRPRGRKAVRETIWKLIACRTAALGTRVYECPSGHGESRIFNQCRHRWCPLCSGRKRWDWYETQAARLLKCPHFHVVITLPSELHGLWRYNRQRMARLLFWAAATAVTDLLADPAYMGGMPGVIGVLHTSGGMLVLHPHVHLVVSLVGLSPRGELVRARRLKLLPYDVLRVRFRDVFLRSVKRMFVRGELYLPRGTSRAGFRRMIEKLWRRPKRYFNLRVLRRDNYLPTLKYLARTIYGGPLPNRDILEVRPNGVRFRYRSWHGVEEGQKPNEVESKLGVDTFVSRWADHVPQKGMQMVRSYGLYANKRKADLARVHELLGDEFELPETKRGVGQGFEPREERRTCEVCGAVMRVRTLDRAPHPIHVIESDALEARLLGKQTPPQGARGPPCAIALP